MDVPVPTVFPCGKISAESWVIYVCTWGFHARLLGICLKFYRFDEKAGGVLPAATPPSCSQPGMGSV
jgi:hypothetical protein